MNYLKSNFLFILLALISCTENKDDQSPQNLPYSFIDGFETTNNLLEDLFLADGTRWTGIQRVNPTGLENQLELNQSIVSEGSSSLRLFSHPSDNTLSKIDIEKAGFFAPSGSTLIVEADFFINSTENLRDLFLMDVECCSCWDDSVPDNQCPGIRLKMGGDNDFLSIERGKILGTTISQTQVAFPRQEWVNVRCEMKLSPDGDAENRLSINQEQVINATGKNLPNREEFRTEFAENGIDFELQDDLGYERVQLGATANPTPFAFEIYVDNFRLEIE